MGHLTTTPSHADPIDDPQTAAEYRAKYPNATICPEHDPDDQAMFNGVCGYCICGCDWCEAGRPAQ